MRTFFTLICLTFLTSCSEKQYEEKRVTASEYKLLKFSNGNDSSFLYYKVVVIDGNEYFITNHSLCPKLPPKPEKEEITQPYNPEREQLKSVIREVLLEMKQKDQK